MKKEATLLVLLTFCFITSHSQAENHKSYLGISIGPSFPVSHFAKDNLSDKSSGFANTGQADTISYARLIGKRFGIAANLQGQRNPLNVHSIEEQFSKTSFTQGIWTATYPGEPHPPLPTVIYPNWKFESESWLLGSLLLGGCGEFPSGNEKIAFTAKAMAGAIYATAPEANGSSITDTATASFVQTKTSAFGISYSMNACFKYDINKSLCLLTTVEYLETSNLKFDASNVTFTATHGTPGSPEIQRIGNLCVPQVKIFFLFPKTLFLFLFQTIIMIEAVIWDYDGTLVDTRQKNLNVTREIVLEMLKKNYEEFPALVCLENYEKAHTRSVNWRDLYSHELHMDEVQTDYAGSLWTKYQILNTSKVNFYKGLPEIITALGHSYRQAIVSLNSCANISNELMQNGLQNYFTTIFGYEEVDFSKQKPDPVALLKCISHLDLIEREGTIVYIGDHETDAHCVFNANQALGKKKIFSIAALYEKECTTQSWKYQPDYIASAVKDIPEIIETIV